MSELPPIPVKIRSYEPKDDSVCQALYRDGLIGGQLATNDTGLDLDNIQATYMAKAGSHFWVAEDATGRVVGMIGVQHHDTGIGEIRRLRVHQDCRRRGIGTALLETAIRFCREKLFLKIKMDTFTEYEAAVRLFEKFQFRHADSRNIGNRTMLYFYLDLYLGEHTGRRR